jgi:hypothetical protein
MSENSIIIEDENVLLEDLILDLCLAKKVINLEFFELCLHDIYFLRIAKKRITFAQIARINSFPFTCLKEKSSSMISSPII